MLKIEKGLIVTDHGDLRVHPSVLKTMVSKYRGDDRITPEVVLKASEEAFNYGNYPFMLEQNLSEISTPNESVTLKVSCCHREGEGFYLIKSIRGSADALYNAAQKAEIRQKSEMPEQLRFVPEWGLGIISREEEVEF